MPARRARTNTSIGCAEPWNVSTREHLCDATNLRAEVEGDRGSRRLAREDEHSASDRWLVSASYGGFNQLRRVYDGPLEDRCGRHPLLPLSALRVDGGQIPENVFLKATALRRLRRSRVVCEPAGEDMIFVPVLPHPRVGQSRQHAGVRWGPIGRQHRLPDRNHANGGAWVLLEDLFDCGGPRRQVDQVGARSRTTRV